MSGIIVWLAEAIAEIMTGFIAELITQVVTEFLVEVVRETIVVWAIELFTELQAQMVALFWGGKR
ncbi:hypothetical protein [Phormidesmis priestleyi]